MPLLEREHHLEVLDERARHAFAGQGGVVLVAGEAGIGKTLLIGRFVERVRSRVQSLWGMCDPLSTPRPLGPLRDVAGELAPSVSALLNDSAAQHEIFTAVLDALRGRPRVFVVEDLHWADEATLDLMRYLARRIHTLPLLLVLTYRDALAPDHPLSPVLGDLVATPEARRLQLTPLSRSAVQTLVADHGLDPVDVHRRTAGNPFFVSQILAQPGAALPETVRDAVLARTAGLTPAARRCLELLSCTPEPVGAEQLAALEVSPDTIEILAGTGLLDRRGDGVAFRHEIARSAVLGACAPGSEPGLHVAMIVALEAVDGDASVLAHHAAAAGDTQRVLAYAPRAAVESARSGAHREAAAFYRTALTFASDSRSGTSEVDLAELLESLADELYLTDRLDEAIDVGGRALDLRLRLAEPVAIGFAHRALAAYCWYAADRETADRHDRAAVDILTDAGDQQALGMALATHAFLAAHRGDTAAAVDASSWAMRIARDLDHEVLLSSATIGSSIARLLDGDLSARAELRAASDVGLRHGIDDLATTPLSNLCHLDVEQARFTDAETTLAHAMAVSEARGDLVCVRWQRGVRARLRLRQGRWDEAELDAHAVLAAGELPLGRIWPNLVLGILAARREAPAQNPHLDELWRLTGGLNSPGTIAVAASALAEQAWLTRRPDPRLDGPSVQAMFAAPFAGRDGAIAPLLRWLRRLSAAGIQHVGTGGLPAPTDPVPADQRYEQAMTGWDLGSTGELLAALSTFDELGATVTAALVRGRLRAAGVAGGGRG
ncbi:MAG TPA: AAA family ATPase, partial [Nakamurella sp.]